MELETDTVQEYGVLFLESPCSCTVEISCTAQKHYPLKSFYDALEIIFTAQDHVKMA